MSHNRNNLKSSQYARILSKTQIIFLKTDVFKFIDAHQDDSRIWHMTGKNRLREVALMNSRKASLKGP